MSQRATSPSNQGEGLQACFYDLIRNLRRVQARYVKLRNAEDLELSKALKAQVRESLAWIQWNPGKISGSLPGTVQKMITAQTEYYKQRTSDRLQRAKALEREIDKSVAEFFDTQTSLIDE